MAKIAKFPINTVPRDEIGKSVKLRGVSRFMEEEQIIRVNPYFRKQNFLGGTEAEI